MLDNISTRTYYLHLQTLPLVLITQQQMFGFKATCGHLFLTVHGKKEVMKTTKTHPSFLPSALVLNLLDAVLL